MKKVLLLIALALSLGFAANRANATIMLTLDPAARTIAAGSTFSVDVFAQIPDTEGLVGWGFGLVFNDAQVAFQGATAGPLWDLALWPTPSTALDPLVALLPPTSTSPAGGVTGNKVLLATLSWLCLTPGSSVIDISVADPSVDPNQGFMTAAGEYATWTSVGATVTQVTGGIPEPASILLMLAALGAVAWVRRSA